MHVELVLQIINCLEIYEIFYIYCFQKIKNSVHYIFRVDLWNNGNLIQDVFLGEIKVPVKVLRNDSFQAW